MTSSDKVTPGTDEGKAPVAQALAGKLRIQPATNSLGVLCDLLYPEGCVKTYLACDLPAPVAAKLQRAWNAHNELLQAITYAVMGIKAYIAGDITAEAALRQAEQHLDTESFAALVKEAMVTL